MPLQGRLSVEHMCQLVVVSRRGFYRSLRQREPAEEETEVRSLIQQIALEHRRRYGYRRITAELHRRGVQVNRKKVEAQEGADTARKALAHLSLWLFAALLIGAFCASFSATIGGRQRDHVKLV
jgi:transposase InsO family protein